MKKSLLVLLVCISTFLTSFGVTQAATILFPSGGGTGWGFPGGLQIHSVLIGNGLNPISTTSPSTAGYVLTSNGPSLDPTFQASSGGGTGPGNVSTSTNETSGFLAYWTSTNATPALLGKVATTTFTPSAEFTIGGTIGAFVGGANSTLTLATNGIALTKLAQVAANTVLGNATGATANITAFATSTLGIALSDTTGVLGETRGGTNQSTYTKGDTLYASAANTLAKLAIGTGGQILAVVNGIPGWVGTTTAGTGLTYTGGAPGSFSVNTTQNITNLSNLSTNALVVTSGGNGTLGAYAGTSCTNQFVRSLSLLGVATCATVGAADVSLANLTATDATLAFSGTYNGSTARTIGLNLGNANTWSALQQFGANASTTMFSSYGPSYFGATATSSFASDGTLTLAGISGTQCLHSISGVVSGTGSDCGSGSGTGSVSTSTAETAGQVPVWDSTSATPALLWGGVANFTFGKTSSRLSIPSNGWYGIGGNLFAYASTTNGTVVLGMNAGGTNATTSAALRNNVIIGNLAYSGGSGSSNVVIGYSAAVKNTSSNNVAIGQETLGAGSIVTSGSNNVALGYQSLLVDSTGSANTALGFTSLPLLSKGVGNIAVGANSGYNVNTGSDNILIGQVANNGGGNLTSGSGNILVGYNATPPTSSTNRSLNIGNFIFGTLPATTTATSQVSPISGTLGIGSTTPWAKFSVQTNNGDTNLVLFAIGSSTASATTTLFSVNNIGSTTMGSFGPCSGSSALNTDANGTIICGAANGLISSVSNADGTLTISPTTGAVVASLALGHANTWSALQQFGAAASSTQISAYTGAYFGATATTTITAGGFVGIGTSTPYAQLSINSTNATVPFVIGSSTAELFKIADTGVTTLGGTNPTIYFNTSSSPVAIRGIGNAIQFGTPIGSGNVRSEITGSGFLRFTTSGQLQWTNSNTDPNTTQDTALGRSAAGIVSIYGASNATLGSLVALKIGVGTTSPLAQLDIAGANNGTNLLFQLSSVASFATTTQLVVTNGGFLGLASTSPWGQFSVNPTALGSGVPEFVIGSSTATHLLVDGAGNVGIGTSSPYALFSVNAPAGTLPYFAIGSSTAEVFKIIPSATTALGVATSSPWRTLGVTGTVGFDGLTGSAGLQVGILCLSATKEVINESVACVASAKRYKENIKTLNVGLDEVLKLRAVSFTWKKDYNGALDSDPNKNGVQYSLIADEVQKIDPRLVSVTLASTTFEGKSYPAGTVQGLADTNHWVGLFVKSFQDMEGQVQKLTARVSGLDSKLDRQQAQILRLQQEIDELKK